jgi:hypothetical protein
MHREAEGAAERRSWSIALVMGPGDGSFCALLRRPSSGLPTNMSRPSAPVRLDHPAADAYRFWALARAHVEIYAPEDASAIYVIVAENVTSDARAALATRARHVWPDAAVLVLAASALESRARRLGQGPVPPGGCGGAEDELWALLADHGRAAHGRGGGPK